jgi:hypothetical protein
MSLITVAVCGQLVARSKGLDPRLLANLHVTTIKLLLLAGEI